MTEYIIHRDDELTHYGVKGSKWGIRRYQNEDGSYKPGAEGRYYQATGGKKTISGTMKNVSTQGGGYSVKTTSSKNLVRELHKSRGYVIEEGQKKSGGGSSSGSSSKPVEKPKEEEKKEEKDTSQERAINKTINGKDIDVKDVSEKLDKETLKAQKAAEKKAASGSGSGKSSSSSSEKESSFKVSKLIDKIDNYFDMDDMTDADWEEMELSSEDIDELDDLISQYQTWRSSNSSNTKKTKKIDAFIERYTAWKSNHKSAKHSEPREVYLIHHGVRGMKWGIRRYQNEDGSYKAGAEGRYDPEPSGKKRKKSSENSSSKSKQSSSNKEKDEQHSFSNYTKRRIDRKIEALKYKAIPIVSSVAGFGVSALIASVGGPAALAYAPTIIGSLGGLSLYVVKNNQNDIAQVKDNWDMASHYTKKAVNKIKNR